MFSLVFTCSFAHRAQSANVLVKSERADRRRGFKLCVADFGLSRLLLSQQSHLRTRAHGAAAYAAPEV